MSQSSTNRCAILVLSISLLVALNLAIGKMGIMEFCEFLISINMFARWIRLVAANCRSVRVRVGLNSCSL